MQTTLTWLEVLIKQWAAPKIRAYAPLPGAMSTEWISVTSFCTPDCCFFFSFFFLERGNYKWRLEHYLSLASGCWFEGFFCWLAWWVWDLKMGGFGVLVANCLWVFLFSPFAFLSGIAFRAFFFNSCCISFTPSHFTCSDYFLKCCS